MKVLIFSSLLVVAISASVSNELRDKFQAFKLQHGKIYLNQAEETKRFNIFKDKVRAIEEHNALFEQGKKSYKKGINQFTDMTQEEFNAMQTLSVSQRPTLKTNLYVKTGLEIPPSVDWRQKGQVTEVKNQGKCGSCWAFSITGSTEAAYYRKSGKLVALSEQQMVDCSTDINSGCDGGRLDPTFTYVMENGLQSESSYPYKGVDQDCAYSASSVVTKISNYTVIEPLNEDALLDAVANIGPVSAAIYSWYLVDYESGILEEEGCYPYLLNHAILIVGYGTENGKDFWIGRNSHGKNWGEKGYFRIVRGKNECGIAADTVLPIID